MEDALSDLTLLPDGVETSFPDIESTIARLAAGDRRSVTVARSLASAAISTVVAVGSRDRLVESAAALREHARSGGIRAILIASGDRATPRVRVTSSEIALEGLQPDFIDNAVAALRLSSLPMLLWWRGGEPVHAEKTARVADRLVLDAEDPRPLWARIEQLSAHVPVSDLRWTSLTRWRALMAHFFDSPAVQAAAAAFNRLHITGSDGATARLFAGWLISSLKNRSARVRIEQRPGPPIQAIVFGSDTAELALRRLHGTSCVEGHAVVDGRDVSRVSHLGNQDLAALVAEELRVRARDAAFEAAVTAAGAIP